MPGLEVSRYWSFLMRHRVAIRDVAVSISLAVSVGLAAWKFSFTGSSESSPQIELEELVTILIVVGAAITYVGWRRIRDQEREINRRIEAERHAHELAHTDPLTGLANRRVFETAVSAAVKAPPGAEQVHAILMLDLNGFKKVNDIYGHPAGDDVLAIVSDRLREVTRDRDTLARLGGDEFAMVAHHLSGPDAAAGIASRIAKVLDEPVVRGLHSHQIGAGIGIALIPRDGDNPEDVARKADIALYRAKSEGHSAICFFEEEMDRRVRERDKIETELAKTIGTDALVPWYQPIIDLRSGEVVEFEALARWAHPTLGELPPDRFIPVAESTGLIGKLGDWLLKCAARDAASWPANVMLSFNISPMQLKDRTLGLRILNILADEGLSPRRLEIEVTESAIVRDLEAAQQVLSSLRDAGVRIALDDFGTGYSSLYHLRNFKVDKIKIDRSFIKTMAAGDESAAIVKALLGLGSGLGLTVTAEGIEGQSELEMLLDQGCEQGQGFLFSKAVPSSATVRYFKPVQAPAKVLQAPGIA